MAERDCDSLISAHRTACLAWQDARGQWRDSVASDFGRDCWIVFDQAAGALISATAELEEALEDAESVVARTPGRW